MKFVLKYWWLWIILISFTAYAPVLDNFFTWDDFLWLYRAKTFWTNIPQIFKSEGLYFDPVVHLAFWLDFNLFGLDYRWYHLTDILLHTANAILVFHLVKLYSKDEVAAFISGVIFASTFGSSDAVLWSSARVDLLSTLFSLVSLIMFLQYLLYKQKAPFIAASIFAYVLALCSKGTPVVIPALLLWIIVKEKKNSLRSYTILLPFVFTSLIYFILLWVSSDGHSPILKGASNLNFYNYSLAITSLFLPENILPRLNLNYTFVSTFLILSIILVIKFPAQIDRIKSFGLFMTFLFITPILALGPENFTLATTDPKYLLASPSHRIYLASIGMSVFVSSIVVWLNHVFLRKGSLIIPAVLVILLSLNIYETWQREKIWDMVSRDIKDTVYSLKRIKLHIPDGSVIIGINFPMSGGFIEPMLKLYYDLKEVTYFHIKELPEELPEHQLSFGREYTLFFKKWNILLIRGSDTNIYDLRHQFYELSEIAINYRNTSDIEQQARYYQEYKAMAAGLDQYIRLL